MNQSQGTCSSTVPSALEWDHFLVPKEIRFSRTRLNLKGSLFLPEVPRGLILIPRINVSPPDTLFERITTLQGEAQFATLQLNLSDFSDDPRSELHHNVPLLTQRLLDGLTGVQWEPLLRDLPCALLARGPLVAPAMRASAQRDSHVRALVCQGGLPDQTGRFYLENLCSPTLLMFESMDMAGMASGLRCQNEKPSHCFLHRFPEQDSPKNALDSPTEIIAQLACQWFNTHLLPA